MTMETIKAKKLTLYQALLERRVPQICGFYLGASWGLIQFIEWVFYMSSCQFFLFIP